MKKKVLLTILSLMLILMVGCGGNDGGTPVDEPNGSKQEQSSEEVYSFGSEFDYDDFHVTIGTEVEWDVVDNSFSDHDGQKVAKIALTQRNDSGETGAINPYSISLYGADGNTMSNLGHLFNDSWTASDEMRPEAEDTRYIYFIYEGEGDYYIEFDDFSNPIEVKIPITDPEA